MSLFFHCRETQRQSLSSLAVEKLKIIIFLGKRDESYAKYKKNPLHIDSRPSSSFSRSWVCANCEDFVKEKWFLENFICSVLFSTLVCVRLTTNLKSWARKHSIRAFYEFQNTEKSWEITVEYYLVTISPIIGWMKNSNPNKRYLELPPNLRLGKFMYTNWNSRAVSWKLMEKFVTFLFSDPSMNSRAQR